MGGYTAYKPGPGAADTPPKRDDIHTPVQPCPYAKPASQGYTAYTPGPNPAPSGVAVNPEYTEYTELKPAEPDVPVDQPKVLVNPEYTVVQEQPTPPAVPPPPPISYPLKAKGMEPSFVGEHLPGNTTWPGKVVQYLDTEEKRAPYKLTIRDGKLFGADGKPFDTSKAKSVHSKNPVAIFVMDPQGNLYASPYQEIGKFHHSSLLGGKPVAAAGELTVINGKLVGFSDRSGHYKPPPENMNQFVAVMQSKGVNMDKSIVKQESWKTG